MSPFNTPVSAKTKAPVQILTAISTEFKILWLKKSKTSVCNASVISPPGIMTISITGNSLNAQEGKTVKPPRAVIASFRFAKVKILKHTLLTI